MAEKPIAPRHNHLQSDPIPFSMVLPKQLAQFKAATAQGYQPRPQSKVVPPPNTDVSKTVSTTHSVTPQASSLPISNESAAVSHPAGTLLPPPTQTIDLSTFRGLKFVSLDQFLVEVPTPYETVSGTFQWEMCETENDRCIEFIRDNCATKRVFLVCSGSQGQKVIPVIHSLPQVYAIYIHCASLEFHREWTRPYVKVRDVRYADREVLLQMAVDIAQSNLEWGDALFKQGKTEDAKKKFMKALETLTNHTKNKHAPAMENELRKKIEQCK